LSFLSAYSLAFLLHLKLWAAIDPTECSWDYGSVGRVSIRLRKSVAGKIWPQLLGLNHKRPSNMHTWWEMQSTFDAEEKAKQEADKKAREEADKKLKEKQEADKKAAQKKKESEKEAKEKKEVDEKAKAEAKEDEKIMEGEHLEPVAPVPHTKEL
jgi:hypothetical protein